MPSHKFVTAGLLIIGDEILSGRTLDTNTHFLTQELSKCGIQVKEVSIIPDCPLTIQEKIKYFSACFDYVFTTGGIGPTHDDKTAQSIAKAFNLNLIRHPEAEKIIRQRPIAFNESALKMADIPEKASLLTNPINGAPGFKLYNIYVMAGVPSIMKAMFHAFKNELKKGDLKYNMSFICQAPESHIASYLTDFEAQYEEYITIGSYPQKAQDNNFVEIILSSYHQEQLEKITQEFLQMMQSHSFKIQKK